MKQSWDHPNGLIRKPQVAHWLHSVATCSVLITMQGWAFSISILDLCYQGDVCVRDTEGWPVGATFSSLGDARCQGGSLEVAFDGTDSVPSKHLERLRQGSRPEPGALVATWAQVLPHWYRNTACGSEVGMGPMAQGCSPEGQKHLPPGSSDGPVS